MKTVDLILLLLGLACFVLAAAGVAMARLNLIALGLAAWIAVPLIALIRSF